MANPSLKQAKKRFKSALKNIDKYIADRDDMVRQILNSRTPLWGSLNLIMVDWMKIARKI